MKTLVLFGLSCLTFGFSFGNLIGTKRGYIRGRRLAGNYQRSRVNGGE